MSDSQSELLRQARAFFAFQGELGLSGVDADLAPSGSRAASTVASAAATTATAAAPVRGYAPVSTKLPGRSPHASVVALAPGLQAIRDDLGDCTRCKLHGKRTNIVFGVGNPKARLMFVGEAPGRDEDLLGEPFVGAAGQLLDKMIKAMGLSRGEIYIANILKCRPPQNRDPEPDEVEQCEPFLKRQIAEVKPEVLVALGRIAAQTLLRDPTPVSRLRGVWREYEGTPLMPTFHPAYLLRNPADKKPVWDDLLEVMRRLGLSPPAR
jgi:uracil-DNA glycosylase